MVEQNTASHQYGNFMGDQNGLKAIRIRQITVIIPSQIALFKSLDFMSLLFESTPFATSSLICFQIFKFHIQTSFLDDSFSLIRYSREATVFLGMPILKAMSS